MVWSISGKTAVITGASSGIGLETARALAERGARVVMVVRSEARGRAAREKILETAPEAAVELVLADLSARSELRRAAAEILERCPSIELLINNAGAVNTDRHVTDDGLELTFAVNHLAYFELTALLLDRIKRSAPARIISVASDAHHRARLDLDDLQGEKRWNGWIQYCNSKLENVLFTRELARRLEGTGVTATCLHPGVIASSFGQSASGPINWFFRFARPFLLDEKQGAATTIHLATAPESLVTSGEYYAKKKVARSSSASRDPEAARRLWAASEALIQRA